jgi:hypothetical protein
VFEASFPSGTFRVARHEEQGEDGDLYTSYHLVLMNGFGKEVETIFPFEVRTVLKGANALLGSLFSQARDRALGIAETADDLLNDLGGPVPLDPDDEIPF